MQPHALAGPPSAATPGGPEQTPPLQHRPLPVPVSPPVAAAPVFSPASSPNQPNRRGSGANRSVASPIARARVPGGHGIPLSFGRATLPIPPPSPPPDMSPQSFTAKAAQAALAAAAAAANKAQERRVHQPAVGHELVMLRDAANAANIAAAAGVNKTEPQPQVVLESRDRATNTTAELADRIERGRSQQPTQPPQQAQQQQQQQLQQQQQHEQQQPQQQGEAQHDRKRPIAFTPNTYKTEICRSHASTGNCEYGAYCQFAHGVAELRARDFDVKYKTKLCKNFYETGHCRFASRCKFIHDEQRVQVSETEFWLVSPSDNLVRVEVAHTPERRAQLQSLVTSTFTPPPYRVSPTHAPAPSSAPLAPVSNPSGTLPPPFALTDPAIPVRRNRDGSAIASDDTTTDLHNTVAAFQTLAIAPPVPASPQLQVPYFQYTVTAEPPPVFPMYGAPPPSATAPVPVYPSPLPYGSPLLGARGPGPDGYFVPHKGPAPPPPLVLAGPPVPPPPPAMLIATQPHHVQAFPVPLPPPPHVLAPPRVSRANLTDVSTPTVSLRAPAQFHVHTATASST